MTPEEYDVALLNVLRMVDRLGGGSSVPEKVLLGRIEAPKDQIRWMLRMAAQSGGLTRVGNTWGLTPAARERLDAHYEAERAKVSPPEPPETATS